MASDDSFNDVLERCRQKDAAAFEKVYQRFFNRLIALAWNNLDPRLRQKAGPEDMAQSALGTIWRRIGEGQFNLGSWDGLWSLLARATIYKCRKWADHFHADRRNVNQEIYPSLEESAMNLIDNAPTPFEALVLVETIEKMQNGLSELEQKIVQLSLESMEPAEISAKLTCTLSKVYRVRKFIKKRLQRMQLEG